MSNLSISPRVDAHEDRILRLEANMLDMAIDVSETKVRVESLDEKFDTMDGKLDRILQAVERHHDRLMGLESTEKTRKGLSKWVMGIVSAVTVGAILAFFGLK